MNAGHEYYSAHNKDGTGMFTTGNGSVGAGGMGNGHSDVLGGEYAVWRDIVLPKGRGGSDTDMN